jgi:uncharacterized membrane protein
MERKRDRGGMHALRALAVSSLAALVLAGCNSWFWGGAAAGAAGSGAVYEYQNKDALDQLEEEFEKGKISRDEYQRRRDEIQDRSLIY